MPGFQVEGGVVAWNLDGASIRSMDPRPQQEDWPQHPPFDTPSSRRCSRICRHGQMNFWPGTAIDATAGNIVSKVPTGIAGRSSAMAASVSSRSRICSTSRCHLCGARSCWLPVQGPQFFSTNGIPTRPRPVAWGCPILLICTKRDYRSSLRGSSPTSTEIEGPGGVEGNTHAVEVAAARP